MANKYSRYQLNPFPSLYVDDRKVDISQLLAQRYDANKKSKDLIDRTLSQMELLDGDKSHGERVKSSVKDMLNSHIERGDWENSSLVVADAANLVSTDAGLIAANQSWKYRSAEIEAIREAKINGIPMIDFGENARKIHESYVYDPETETYVTNIYEPMSERMLDYRSRKQNMVGKIPASQAGNWMGVSRGKTNRIANMLVDQYIADTHEGIQEYKYLVEVALPQTLPLEERMKMAKNQIRQDFKEVARQQEFDKVSGTEETNRGGPGLAPGTTIKSSVSSQVNTRFEDMDDKIRGIQEENLFFIDQLNRKDLDPGVRDAYQTNLANNQKIFKENLKKVANENGTEGKRAYEKYLRLEERFMEFGEDGQRLLAATQYLTYNTSATDTDWDLVSSRTAAGAFAGGAGGVTYGSVGGSVVGPGGTVIGGTALGAVGVIGGGILGFAEGVGEGMFGDLRNVRDWHRPQEGGVITGSLGLTDNEREQLAEELWGDEDYGDASVDHINKILLTNFNEKDKAELMKMTNAYYTFMTKDGSNRKDGKTRLSGDQLLEKTLATQFVNTQPVVGFDMTDTGKKLRNNTASYIQNEIDLNNSGLASDGMLPGSKALNDWINDEDNGGIQNLQLEGVRMGDILTNTPMMLSFGFKNDGTGTTTRDFYVTDPTVIQPGGWVYDLLDENFGLADKVYDENIRREYNRVGYDNVKVGNYINDMATKNVSYSGGTNEDLIAEISVMQNEVIMDILLNPSINLPQYPLNDQGVRTIVGTETNQPIPFTNPDGSFNQAAWTILQSQPANLAKLRTRVLNMPLPEVTGYKF